MAAAIIQGLGVEIELAKERPGVGSGGPCLAHLPLLGRSESAVRRKKRQPEDTLLGRHLPHRVQQCAHPHGHPVPPAPSACTGATPTPSPQRVPAVSQQYASLPNAIRHPPSIPPHAQPAVLHADTRPVLTPLRPPRVCWRRTKPRLSHFRPELRYRFPASASLSIHCCCAAATFPLHSTLGAAKGSRFPSVRGRVVGSSLQPPEGNYFLFGSCPCWATICCLSHAAVHCWG